MSTVKEKTHFAVWTVKFDIAAAEISKNWLCATRFQLKWCTFTVLLLYDVNDFNFVSVQFFFERYCILSKTTALVPKKGFSMVLNGMIGSCSFIVKGSVCFKVEILVAYILKICCSIFRHRSMFIRCKTLRKILLLHPSD